MAFIIGCVKLTGFRSFDFSGHKMRKARIFILSLVFSLCWSVILLAAQQTDPSEGDFLETRSNLLNAPIFFFFVLLVLLYLVFEMYHVFREFPFPPNLLFIFRWEPIWWWSRGEFDFHNSSCCMELSSVGTLGLSVLNCLTDWIVKWYALCTQTVMYDCLTRPAIERVHSSLYDIESRHQRIRS